MPLGSSSTCGYWGRQRSNNTKSQSWVSQGHHSNLDIPHTRDMDRPTFYYENIVYYRFSDPLTQ